MDISHKKREISLYLLFLITWRTELLINELNVF